MLEKIAKANGYSSVDRLLMDYGFIPTVLMPKHKKIEIVKAIMKSFINKWNIKVLVHSLWLVLFRICNFKQPFNNKMKQVKWKEANKKGMFISFKRLKMAHKKSNRKAETVNINLEIAKDVIELIVALIIFIKSLGN